MMSGHDGDRAPKPPRCAGVRRKQVVARCTRAALGRAVAVLGLVVLVAGCGQRGELPSPPTPPPAVPLRDAPEPAVSPPAALRLPGTVVTVGGAPEGIAITDAGTVAVNVRDPDRPDGGLLIFPISAPTSASTTTPVDLGATARHLTLAGPAGPALVAEESDDEFLRVALPGGQVLASVRVGHQPHEAIAINPTTYFVFDELANTIHIVIDDRVSRVVAAPLQPGGGALSSDHRHVVAVGVRGWRIAEYSTSGDLVGSANCGAGPTHVITGDDGLFWVNDTGGGSILGFRLTDHGPQQVATIPVGAGSKPYGIAYDTHRHTLWVTLTGRNQLLGLTLHDTTIIHRTTYDTVAQPNTVAVDQTTGQLVVTGSTPASTGHLQFLP